MKRTFLASGVTALILLSTMLPAASAAGRNVRHHASVAQLKQFQNSSASAFVPAEQCRADECRYQNQMPNIGH
jgi:hypothetical protein